MDVNELVEAERTPALDAARAEMTEIATNPSNPRYAGYQRGDPQVSAYIDGLYKQAVPDAAPVRLKTESVSVGPVEPQPGETPEAAAIRTRNDVILAPLKQEWGPLYERRFAAAQAVMGTLFEGRGEVLDDLGEIVRITYGPKGEAAVLKLFAELEDIKQGG
jgi:hypothetical protein